MQDLIDRLRDQRCDREPFTPDHVHCTCRLTHAAADEIEKLRRTIMSALDCLHHDDKTRARQILATK